MSFYRRLNGAEKNQFYWVILRNRQQEISVWSRRCSLNLETECLLSSEINPDAQLVYQYRVGD